MSNKSCPLCKKKLALKQVHFDLAVYICEDLECKYPIDSNCIVVERKLEDMNKEVLDEDDDLADWVSEIVRESEKPARPQGADDARASRESIEWIDSLVEEAVNEVRQYEAASEVTTDRNGAALVEATDFDDILNFMYSG